MHEIRTTQQKRIMATYESCSLLAIYLLYHKYKLVSFLFDVILRIKMGTTKFCCIFIRMHIPLLSTTLVMRPLHGLQKDK